MDDKLKGMMQDLGNAINESLSNSEDISEVIGEIKKEGYDVFLVLEATIGFNKREDDPDTPDFHKANTNKSGSIAFTDQDCTFLKALRINLDGG